MRKIDTIVLHYSATYADQDIGEKEIRAMHKARGFRTTGYHYVIRRNGVVEVGRPEVEVGAHVSGYNSNSIGICCIGGLERATGPNKGVDNRTDAQKASTIKLVKELLAKYPGAKLVGHRDLGATQCPGFDVKTWWASVTSLPSAIPAVAEDDAADEVERLLVRVTDLETRVAQLSKAVGLS